MMLRVSFTLYIVNVLHADIDHEVVISICRVGDDFGRAHNFNERLNALSGCLECSTLTCGAELMRGLGEENLKINTTSLPKKEGRDW